MIVSIHQPDYLPWLGYFYKIAKSDVFVILDDAQYSNNNMHNWNKIKTPQGELRLKIPVRQSLGDKINEVRTKDELGWKEKHLKTIEMNYKKATYFNEIYQNFADILLADYKTISELNTAIIRFYCERLGIRTKFVHSSDLKITTAREERVIDIVTTIGGNVYYSGNGAKAYQVEEHFTQRGIKLQYTDFVPFEYEQLWGKFIPGLSFVDYVMNCGYRRLRV